MKKRGVKKKVNLYHCIDKEIKRVDVGKPKIEEYRQEVIRVTGSEK